MACRHIKISNTRFICNGLDGRVNAQDNFFRHQQTTLKWADEVGPSEISNQRNEVKFMSLTNCINTWVSVPKDEVNWFTKHPECEYQLHVSAFSFSFSDLIIERCHQKYKSIYF